MRRGREREGGGEERAHDGVPTAAMASVPMAAMTMPTRQEEDGGEERKCMKKTKLTGWVHFLVMSIGELLEPPLPRSPEMLLVHIHHGPAGDTSKISVSLESSILV